MIPRSRFIFICVLMLVLSAGMAHAASDGERGAPGEEEKSLVKKSLPFRKALHRAPTMGPPFERLYDLYAGVDRVDELVAMYASHLNSYPEDVNARIVWLRLLVRSGHSSALEEIQSAVKKHSDRPYLHYLEYHVRHKNHDPRAVNALNRAIERAERPSRRRNWIDVMLKEASSMGRRDLVEQHLQNLSEMSAGDPGQMLRTARRMIDHDFPAMALKKLEQAEGEGPSPETSVEIQMAAATAEVALDRSQKAARRLDALLDKLTPDYWRRPEIWRRRIALIEDKKQREAMCAQLRKRLENNPQDEAAALDLAELLEAMDRRRNALDVLLKAGKRMPRSSKIEKETLALFSRLQDERGRRRYLKRRLNAHPGRNRLRLKYVKTLYLIGQSTQAADQLNELLSRLERKQHVDVLLGLARYLRRSLLTGEAVKVYERLLKLTPERLDVRQELAEAYIAQGSRQKARRLLRRKTAERARIENFLDVVRFMISQGMYRDARALLKKRMKKAPANLELRILLLSIHRKLNVPDEGRALVQTARDLADTPPRYRSWLEASAQFYETINQVQSFFGSEQARLRSDLEKDGQKSVELILIYADVAKRNEMRSYALPLLQVALRNTTKEDLRVRVRQALVKGLETDLFSQSGEVQDPDRARRLKHHLAKLAEEDPEYQAACAARRALLELRSGKSKEASKLLAEIDYSRLESADLLRRLAANFGPNLSDSARLEIARRLTEVAPSNTTYWEHYLASLVVTGSEGRLRATLGRLRAGVKKLSLSKKTRALVRKHIIDSYWRSVARRLAGGSEAELADALAFTNELDREVHGAQEQLWVAWARAYLLNQLGREEARVEAVRELERIVSQQTKGETEEEARDLFLTFPDGLTVSLSHAKKLLSSDGGEQTTTETTHSGPGPTPPFRVRWVFETNQLHPILDTCPVDDDRLVVLDMAGGMYCLSQDSGKLIWQRDIEFDDRARLSGTPNHNPRRRRSSAAVPTPRMLVGEDGRIVFSDQGHMMCLSSEDGHVLWRADVAGPTASNISTASGSVPTPIFFHDDVVLAYDPASGFVSAIDRTTGKLRWESAPPDRGEKATKHRLSVLNTGASYSDGRLFVYGARTAILDAETGETIWHFDPERVRKFPVKLESESEVARRSRLLPVSSSGSHAQAIRRAVRQRATRLRRTYRGSYRRSHGQQPPRYYNYHQLSTSQRQQILRRIHMQSGRRVSSHGHHRPTSTDRRTAPVAPAIAWASPHSRRRLGMIQDGRLLLFSDNLLSLRLDIPLAADKFSAPGTIIGSIGERMCMLYRNDLVVQNIRTGERTKFTLGPVSRGTSAPRNIQAAVFGPFVYATGPGGIMCYNIEGGERVFHVPWPPAADVDPDRIPRMGRNTWRMMIIRRPGQTSDRDTRALVPNARVFDGRIVTTTTPGRLVLMDEEGEARTHE